MPSPSAMMIFTGGRCVSSFTFISYSNARKKGQFLQFLLKIAEKEGNTDQEIWYYGTYPVLGGNTSKWSEDCTNWSDHFLDDLLNLSVISIGR